MLRVGLLLLIVPAALLMFFYFYEQAAIDACLDQGGSFNYRDALCDMESAHPFIPLIARYPLQINGAMLISLIGLGMCMKGLLWKGR